jgi:hypothetical protein
MYYIYSIVVIFVLGLLVAGILRLNVYIFVWFLAKEKMVLSRHFWWGMFGLSWRSSLVSGFGILETAVLCSVFMVMMGGFCGVSWSDLEANGGLLYHPP